MKFKRILFYASAVFFLTVISDFNTAAQTISIDHIFFTKKLKKTKFILSTNPITDTDPLNAKSSEFFTEDDKLYGRILLPFKFKKYFDNIGSGLKVRVKQEHNSEVKLIVDMSLNYHIKNETVLDVYFTKKGSKSFKYLQTFLDSLDVGDTKLKFIVQGRDNILIAEEEIIFRNNSGD